MINIINKWLLVTEVFCETVGIELQDFLYRDSTKIEHGLASPLLQRSKITIHLSHQDLRTTMIAKTEPTKLGFSAQSIFKRK